MKNKLTLLVTIFSMTWTALSAPEAIKPEKLTEETIVKLTRESSVLKLKVDAENAGNLLQAGGTDEMFQSRLKAQYLKKRSDEKAPTYQPVLSPYEEASLKIEKKIPVGLAVSAGIFASQSSLQNGTLIDDTQVGAVVSAEMDLWKNIFGQLDRAQINSSEKKKEFARLDSEIQSKRNEIQMRKSYWQLLAVDQSIVLSKSLLKSAEAQSAEAERRLRAGVADRGEVAKYKSQAESRRTSVLFFEYEKELILGQFEKTFLDFKSDQWVVSPNELDQKQEQIFQCLASIDSNTSDLNKTTLLDELVVALKSESESELKLAQNYAGSDFSLFGSYQSTGRSTSYADAQNDLKDEKKSGYTVGLKLTMPLGGAASESEQHLLRAKKNGYEARIVGLQNELNTTHSKMVKAIQILSTGLSTQAETSKALEISYNEMKKKYQQGRVSVVTLTAEQDLIFQSKLQEINIKKQIAQATLDYFSVFGQFPCAWNNI
jgi:hypothetical protein